MINNTDTIAAIATPAGEGGIGVIRISGPDALKVGKKVSRPVKGVKGLTERYLAYGRAIDPSNGVVLDDVLMTFMKGPRSYTGEDVVELYCHGGALVLKKVLEAVLHAGARLAGPGEFTRQAFLNGRLDLAQAEAVIDVIRSQTSAALASARGRLDGVFSKKVNRIKGRLVNLLMHIEAELDFPEDEVEGMADKHLLVELNEAEEEAVRLINTFDEGRAINDGVKTLILGRPNVGKSSLLNLLLKEERAIVTEIPGTTRDVIEEAVNIGGVSIRLMDTAGLRETTDFVESIGVKAAKEKIDAAGLILFVVDSSGADGFKEDLRLLGEVSRKKVIVAANKMDLIDAKQRVKIVNLFSPFRVVFLSATNGVGVDGLEEAVYEEAVGHSFGTGGAGGAGLDVDPGELVVSVRHKNALASAIDGLKRAGGALAEGAPREIVSSELRLAVTRLGEITGEVTTEDILDKIFSEFCIGK
jgi:tRNA modification GTPase